MSDLDSIRIGNRKIAELGIPLEAIKAKEQAELAIEGARQQQINEVKAKFPKHDINFLRSKVAICNAQINTVKKMQSNLYEQIAYYTGLIAECKVRDRELKDAGSEHERKAIRKVYPEYSVPHMQDQIKQFKESIEKGERVILQETASITEFTAVIAKCEERDKQLKALGDGNHVLNP